MVATVHDVAAYILETIGRPISTMKLQKLVYYSQAWHLAWEERLLFNERLEAWVNGPVSPALYTEHRGKFEVSEWPMGDSSALDDGEQETIDIVLRGYGQRSGQWLGAQTHAEDPWRDARRGLAANERSSREIKPSAMLEFYQGVMNQSLGL
jgi:uncharacterized phage-associated protein